MIDLSRIPVPAHLSAADAALYRELYAERNDVSRDELSGEDASLYLALYAERNGVSPSELARVRRNAGDTAGEGNARETARRWSAA